jgi:LacI family transcriptional regulator
MCRVHDASGAEEKMSRPQLVHRPTSHDVARRAGVSRATVSFVLNGQTEHVSEDTRRRVLTTVRELGYAPNASARSLRAGRSNVVLMPMPAYPFSPAVDALIENLARELGLLGLTLLMHGDRAASGIEGARIWAELRPAAVFLQAERCTRRAVQLLRRAGVRAVLLQGPESAAYAPTIQLDQAAAAHRAAEYMVQRGYRRLACLVPGGELALLAEKRLDALAAVATPSCATVERIDCDLSNESLTSSIAHWREARSRPDAVYAYNDEFAVVLIQALRQLGLEVPSGVAVMGSGNLPVGALLRPALSTTYFDMPAIARVVASSIRRLLDGQDLDPGVACAVQPHLIARESA